MTAEEDALLRPASGGRVRLDRTAVTGDGARYDVALATPDVIVHGEAVVDSAGVSVSAPGAADWLLEWTRALVVTLAKRSKEEGWPRRVVRWREPR